MTMYVNKFNAIKIAQEVVDQYYDEIRRRLDIPHLEVEIKTHDECTPGLFGKYKYLIECTRMVSENKVEDNVGLRYLYEESRVILYTDNHVSHIFKDRNMIILKSLFLSTPIKTFKYEILHTLAHEMRHAYQLCMSNLFNDNKFIGNIEVSEYDANKWATEFCKEKIDTM